MHTSFVNRVIDNMTDINRGFNNQPPFIETPKGNSIKAPFRILKTSVFLQNATEAN